MYPNFPFPIKGRIRLGNLWLHFLFLQKANKQNPTNNKKPTQTNKTKEPHTKPHTPQNQVFLLYKHTHP